jgi:hypothetical protein
MVENDPRTMPSTFKSRRSSNATATSCDTSQIISDALSPIVIPKLSVKGRIYATTLFASSREDTMVELMMETILRMRF